MIAKGGAVSSGTKFRVKYLPVTVEAGFERKRDRRAGKNSGRA